MGRWHKMDSYFVKFEIGSQKLSEILSNYDTMLDVGQDSVASSYWLQVEGGLYAINNKEEALEWFTDYISSYGGEQYHEMPEFDIPQTGIDNDAVIEIETGKQEIIDSITSYDVRMIVSENGEMPNYTRYYMDNDKEYKTLFANRDSFLNRDTGMEFDNNVYYGYPSGVDNMVLTIIPSGIGPHNGSLENRNDNLRMELNRLVNNVILNSDIDISLDVDSDPDDEFKNGDILLQRNDVIKDYFSEENIKTLSDSDVLNHLKRVVRYIALGSGFDTAEDMYQMLKNNTRLDDSSIFLVCGEIAETF